jgi:hypothetical protein
MIVGLIVLYLILGILYEFVWMQIRGDSFNPWVVIFWPLILAFKIICFCGDILLALACLFDI